MEKKDLWRDHIVEQVRKARQVYASKFGRDLEAIARDLKRHEEDRDVVSFPPKRLRAEEGAA